MDDAFLTFDTGMRLHLRQAEAYWIADRLELAQDAMQAALQTGFDAGDWYDIQRTIEAEAAARATGTWTWLADELAVEADPSRWGPDWPAVRACVLGAFTAVTDALSVRWAAPTLVTLVPVDEWMDFMHARYGYYMARTERHKVCLPAGATRPAARLARAARHELTHAATYQLAGPHVPRWLDEGAAVLLEGGSPQWELRRYALAYRRRRLPALEDLSVAFGGRSVDLDSPQAAHAYAAAGDFVGRMVSDGGGLSALRRLLSELGAGRRLDRAFHEAFGVKLRRAEARWRDAGPLDEPA